MNEQQKIPEHATQVFKGVIFDIYQWKQELYDGSVTTFEKAKRQGSAAAIPVLENGKLLIAEDEQPGRATVITFPGGRIDEGETPEEGIHRELLEETGYKAEQMILWKENQPVHKIDWSTYVFIARGCNKIKEPNPGPGERLTLKEITLDELLALADNPRFQNVELALDLIKARYDITARAALEKTIFG